MSLSRWNPGCDCCNRALIWDAGVPSHTPLTDWPSQTQTTFVDWTEVRSHFRKVGVEVDFALGDPHPDQGFWGPIGTVTFDSFVQGCPTGNWGPGIDPNTDAVDLGYWTGNIFDYSLVIWHRPLSDLEALGNLCDFVTNTSIFNDEPDPIPCPALEASDSLWVSSGRPIWYDDVFSGKWRGRIVITLGRGAAAGYIITFQSVGKEDLHTAFWQANGMSNGTFVASDTSLGLDFNYHPVRLSASPDPNTLVATEDDLTDGVAPFNGSPPDILSSVGGVQLFRSRVAIDTRGLCGSLNPAHDPNIGDTFDDIPVEVETNRSGIRKTHIKTIDDVDYKADLVVCPWAPLFQEAFVRNLVKARLVPSTGDIT